MVPIIIAVAILVGLGAHFFTKENDSPVEQLAEKVLHMEGVDVDFSAEDKAEAAKKEAATKP